MISARFYFSVIFLGLLSASHCTFDTAEMEAFMNFVGKSEKLFDTVYVFSQLSDDDKIQICSKFSNDKISHVVGEIALVNLDRRFAPDDIPAGMPPIPTITCQTVNGHKFFVTYSGNDIYYNLIDSTYRTPRPSRFPFKELITNDPQKIWVESLTSEVIPGVYVKDLNGTRQGLLEYFQSEYYMELAQKMLQNDNTLLSTICRLFPTKYDKPDDYAAVLDTSPIKVHGQRTKTNIHCVLCYPKGYQNGENTKFKVFYYYGKIFFKSNFYRDFAVEYRLASLKTEYR